MHAFYIFLIYFDVAYCYLWPKGVVHYTVNKKDYDPHSQDEISSTLSRIQREICVKFFNTPEHYNASVQNKILYISNPDKLKNCPPVNYNFSGSVVQMTIGYKCINNKEIARIMVDMLRAGTEETNSPINSYDLIKKFHEEDNPRRTSFLSPTDRNYINGFYFMECGAMARRTGDFVERSRRVDDESNDLFTKENSQYYIDKLWPLGVVMYGVEKELRDSKQHGALKFAMRSIELRSCVVFQEMNYDDVLVPRNLLWFSKHGDEAPRIGFTKGNQTISLQSMLNECPGHSAHVLNNLMRTLGVPMMSNRVDRDNYLVINWQLIDKGKEHYLEKLPKDAFINLPYDFDSVTHAPANYMCNACGLGARTVQPVQDHLWQRTLTMGRRKQLSETDVTILDLLYKMLCNKRKSHGI